MYVELRGPSATDVHHNFVQRWNEASDRERADGLWPDARSQTDAPVPAAALAGRRRRAGADPAHRAARPLPRRHAGAGRRAASRSRDGETAILEQYLRRSTRAQRSIYIEDQAIGAPQIVDALRRARSSAASTWCSWCRSSPTTRWPRRAPRPGDRARSSSRSRRSAGTTHFTLAGIAANAAPGAYQNVYVHAKIALVDDAWATIGSANVANRSFFGDTELNASFWHAPTVRALRARAAARAPRPRHAPRSTTAPRSRLYREVARANARAPRRAASRSTGLAFALDPATYASDRSDFTG